MIPIDIYVHPSCEDIGASANGDVWTCWTKGSGSRRPIKTKYWRLQDTYCGAKFRPKQSIALPVEVATQLGNKNKCRVIAGRFNLECYLGRPLETWEVCRHGIRGNCDHSIGNITVGCQLNNIIDEVIAGRIITNRSQLVEAIERLTDYLSTHVDATQNQIEDSVGKEAV